MTLSLFIGLVSLAVAIGLGTYLIAGGGRVQTSTLSTPEGSFTPEGAVRSMAMPTAGSSDDRAAGPTALASIYSRMGAIATRLSPSDYARRLQLRLDRAGNPRSWSPDRVLAFKGLGLVVGLLLGAAFGLKQGGVGGLAIAAMLAAISFFLPDILIHNLGQKRRIELQKGLPDAMDMMTLCVEAGLGFDAAMSRVARNLTGPAAEEFARVLQEMQLGLSRIEALKHLGDRTNLPELRRFTAAVIQSSELGISIGGVLREQAQEMRIRRRQRAEQKAQQLQVKILLPLISCLLPAIFIVILGPAIIHIMAVFSQVN
jgi:tight adherence protein C